jgi:hypothetical protein
MRPNAVDQSSASLLIRPEISSTITAAVGDCRIILCQPSWGKLELLLLFYCPAMQAGFRY